MDRREEGLALKAPSSLNDRRRSRFMAASRASCTVSEWGDHEPDGVIVMFDCDALPIHQNEIVPVPVAWAKARVPDVMW